jgi:hydroxymethylpyrimidine/phosphomethylpyrimidine kinase
MRPRVLTIAGSDSGGGAGVQADLKTFTVLKTYGASVITALTAQNTLGVMGVRTVEPEFVALQIATVLDDIGADVIKTGMLATAKIVEAVASELEKRNVRKLVIDPVMVAKSGDRLLNEDGIRAVRERLLPLAMLVTPNTEEAAVLAGMESVDSPETMLEAARRIRDFGVAVVLVKGGHLSGASSNDLFFDGGEPVILESPRLEARHTHGTGCTLSAAIAAFLAHGLSPIEAVREAKRFLTGAIRSAWPLGEGIGPVDHLWEWD